MYIGPWQEFKLAKILQLKDKMDKELADGTNLVGVEWQHDEEWQGAAESSKQEVNDEQVHNDRIY